LRKSRHQKSSKHHQSTKLKQPTTPLVQVPIQLERQVSDEQDISDSMLQNFQNSAIKDFIWNYLSVCEAANEKIVHQQQKLPVITRSNSKTRTRSSTHVSGFRSTASDGIISFGSISLVSLSSKEANRFW
jgi:LAS superfamily LD-carboxypeptidase LdcB